MTQDREFERWAGKVWDLGAGLGSEVSLKDFRKDVILELLNEAGQTVMAYDIYPLLGLRVRRPSRTRREQGRRRDRATDAPERGVEARRELAVTETLFDAQLHPIAASVAVELRVQTTGGGVIDRLAEAYAREQHALATLAPPGTLDELGISGVGSG